MSYFPSTQITDNTEASRYAAATAKTTPAASTTDLFTFAGSSTKTVYVTRVELSFTHAGGACVASECNLVKRSTAGSGGTSTTATSVPLDSNSSSATAGGLKAFTVNPTVGALVGIIKAGDILPQYSNGATNTNPSTPNIIIFDAVANQGPIVLRGTSEMIAINFNGTIPAGSTPKLSCTVFWREK